MRKLVAALFLATLVACGGDSLTDVNASIAGSYSLKTVNGSPLPYTSSLIGATRVEVTDDMVTITDAGTYNEIGHLRTTNNGQVTTQSFVDNGTWIRNGTAVTFHSSVDGSDVPASISGSSLTIVDVGLSLVYSK